MSGPRGVPSSGWPYWPLDPEPLPQPAPPAEEWMWPASARDGEPRLRKLGHYRLIGRINSGGQAVIWAAMDTRDDRSVVVKIVNEHAVQSVVLGSRRLAREARILATVGGAPHVVRLLGQGPSTGDGAESKANWLALPVYDHLLLPDAIHRFGPAGVGVGRLIAIELAVALAGLHARGVVHRDLAPGNVFLTRYGVVLADFGVSWSTATEDIDPRELAVSTGLTRGVGVERTEGWFAPEVVSEEGGVLPQRPDRNPAADMFCWGLYVFASVTGRHPWARLTDERFRLTLTGPETTLMRGDPPRWDGEFGPGGETLARLVDAALSIDPAERPSAATVLAVLRGLSPVPVEPRHRSRARTLRRRAWLRSMRVRLSALTVVALLAGTATTTYLVTRDTCAAFRATDTEQTTGAETPAEPSSVPTLDWADMPDAPAVPRTLYAQTFSADDTNWRLGEATGTTSTIDDCSYRIQLRDQVTITRRAIPAPDDANRSDVQVSATASLSGGQGTWGVWCRGSARDGLSSYRFEISHANAVRIVVPNGTAQGTGTGWNYLAGVDSSRPTEVAASCVDVPGVPVRLSMAVNGRTVLTYDIGSATQGALLGPGYSGILASPFADVDPPLAAVSFTEVRIATRA